jgi:hypothetical protein
VEITSALPVKSSYGPSCTLLIQATLQGELDEELAKHKGNQDEIKRLEKKHKKMTDELHVTLSVLNLT